ncbi:MAG: LCP family protein [Lachnospiraceae bacterium]|nr:LCP family protein [Lachnospiraceae bacterium]
MTRKDYNGGSDDQNGIDGFDDPGYDEPEYDEPADDSYYDESDYEEALLLDEEEDADPDDTEYEEDCYDGEADDMLPDDTDDMLSEGEDDIPPDDTDEFIYDEEGNSEPTPTVYYYKDEENYEEDMLYEDPEEDPEVTRDGKKMSLLKKILIGVGIFLFVGILFILFSIFTPAGRELWYSCAGSIWDTNPNIITPEMDKEAERQMGIDSSSSDKMLESILGENADNDSSEPRSEDYVKTFLAFGIEEIGGAANTDTIMLISVNKRDNTIKLTSIMRDTYVNIPGDYPNKINSVYARGAKRIEDKSLKKAGGALLLTNVIEKTFDVDISGYACVNFSSFEKIVDRLGGIDIELGEKEAAYLRKTNYISNPANRTVQAGWNHMNGNQVLGYCRVRKVVTLGGANNDYGRTVRHRRVINAIINKFKSQSFLDILPIVEDCLAEIYTNIQKEQVTDILRDVFENSIFTTASMRLPADEFFTDSGKKGIYNGSSNITYTLVMGDQLGKNIEKFHQFLFLDGEGQTDTKGKVGAGAGVEIGKSGSSSGSSSSSSSASSATPTPVPTQALIDESIPATQQTVPEGQETEGSDLASDATQGTEGVINPETGELLPSETGEEGLTQSGDTQETQESGQSNVTQGDEDSSVSSETVAGEEAQDTVSAENGEETQDAGEIPLILDVDGQKGAADSEQAGSESVSGAVTEVPEEQQENGPVG